MGSFAVGQREAIERGLSGDPTSVVDPAASDRFFQDRVATPLLRSFERDIKPRIDEAFSRVGGSFGSQRGVAAQQSLEEVFNTLASERAGFMREDRNMGFQLRESAAERALRSVGIADQMSMSRLGQERNLIDSQGYFQDYDQQIASAKFAEFLRTAPENNPYFEKTVRALQMAAGTQTMTDTGDSSSLSTIMSGVAAGGSLMLGAGALGASFPVGFLGTT